MAHVRYWAGARAIVGKVDQTIAVASLHELLAAVAVEHGERMAQLLKVSVVLVDGERVSVGLDLPLVDSTVVEILPPYAGG